MVIAKRLVYRDKIKGLDSHQENGITAYEMVACVYLPNRYLNKRFLISRNGCDCVSQTPLHEAYDVRIGNGTGKAYGDLIKKLKEREPFYRQLNWEVQYEETDVSDVFVAWAEALQRYRDYHDPLPPILENPPEEVRRILRPKI